MNNDQNILLIGSGPMAFEYAKVLKKLDKYFIVVGRGKESANKFKKSTGIQVITGGFEKYLSKTKDIPSTAIIAISEDLLGTCTIKLLKRNVKKILVEKPGGLDFADIINVEKLTKKMGAKVFVAYNRRFYSSVEKAKKIIKQDGGILSLTFDFTELSYKIINLQMPKPVKENWFLQNSTHVIDIAFYLASSPKKMVTFINGSLPWHSKAAIFTGSGMTNNNVLFSYHANWKAPGRWGVEIMTQKHKLFLRPLEKLQAQDIGSFEIRDIKLNDDLDTNFKPGLFKEVKSFLSNEKDLCTIKEQIQNLSFYNQILKGKN